MHQDGKTLMEIMVTVAVVGIMAGLAYPIFFSGIAGYSPAAP